MVGGEGFGWLLLVWGKEGEEEEVVVVIFDEEEGRKETQSVPEKRTTLTAKATGRTAVKGLG